MITNDPKNVTVCIGAKTEMSCEVNSSSIIKPKWRIIKRNDSGDIISDTTLGEFDIVNNQTDGLQWKKSLNNGNHMFSLLVGPIDVTYDTSYQCIFSNITESTFGTITVIGTYVSTYVHKSYIINTDFKCVTNTYAHVCSYLVLSIHIMKSIIK